MMPIACASIQGWYPLVLSLAVTATLAAPTPSAWAHPDALVPEGPVLQRIARSGQVRLGYRTASVPFSYQLPDGRPVGYALDLCDKLVQGIRHALHQPGLRVVRVPVTPANRLQLVAQGQVDLECGSTTNNAERRRQVAFTIPHFITGTRLLVPADSPLTELGSFEGRRLVSTTGTTALKAVRRMIDAHLMKIDLREAPDHDSALAQVLNGQADGFAMDEVLLVGLRANHSQPESLKVVGRLIEVETLAIMLQQGDPQFKALVDDEMKRLIREGVVQTLYRRWFEQPIPPKGANLHLPVGYLLRDFWKYPNDFVPN